MRVQGNISPEAVTVEQYLPIPGMVEVRLRENVTQLSDTLYEYDEYKKVIPDRPGLKEDITVNLTDWMTTLRTMEVDKNTSILRAARDENSSLLYEMAALVDDVYNSDMEMMGL